MIWNFLEKKSTIKIFSLLGILITPILSCSVEKEWSQAKIIYSDSFEEEVFARPRKASYYTFIKAKKENNNCSSFILIPEDVKIVQGINYLYISVFFDEDRYGMESYSFARVLAGDSLVLAETKFQAKTCACKTSGAFFFGYFLIYGDKHLKIKIDSKNNVYNRAEIYEFVDLHHSTSLPKEINTINDIIYFLENINN